jgi:hypothetical protein
MLMNDFKKVRGYNPILFLRTAIESSKPAARGATRVAAIAECRNFLCLISRGHSTAAKRRKAADCGTMWHFRWQVARVRHLVAKGSELRHGHHSQRPLSSNKHG